VRLRGGGAVTAPKMPKEAAGCNLPVDVVGTGKHVRDLIRRGHAISPQGWERRTPDPGQGQFFQLSSIIDGQRFYMGFKTGRDGPESKHVTFSKWDSILKGASDKAPPGPPSSEDPEEAASELASCARAGPGGKASSGFELERFFNVTTPFEWTKGQYGLRLKRGKAERGGDWFELTIKDRQTGKQTNAGGLWFRRAKPGLPASIADKGTAIVEVYGKDGPLDRVPPWHIGFKGTMDGHSMTSASSQYPTENFYCDVKAEFPTVDIFRAADSELNMWYGGRTRRKHPAGNLVPATGEAPSAPVAEPGRPGDARKPEAASSNPAAPPRARRP
jgi:hypothetical protein